MKTAIVYYSRHHGNTKRLADAIAARFNVTLIDVTATPDADLNGYDLVGLASGIYYSKFHKSLLQFVESRLPAGKNVFLLYTYGVEKAGYTDAVTKAVQSRGGHVLGGYGCLGFNTFGPFKLIGGIAKGHPDQAELAGAVRFFETLNV